MSSNRSAFLALLVVAALAACGEGGADPSASTAGGAASAVSSNGVTATLTLQSDWTAGYCANVVLANGSTSPVTSWTVVVELGQSRLSNLWGGSPTQSGSQISVKPADYTASIAPGASVSFGFCGAATGSSYRPALVSIAVVGGSTGTSYTLTAQRAGSGAGAVSSTPAGIDCGATCSAPFAAGAVVTLTATPDGNSVFSGWSGACAGTAATCTLTMSAAETAVATFAPKSIELPLLTVTKSGTGSGAVASSPSGVDCGAACTASYASGTAVTLTASPAMGSTFAGWSGACVGTTTTCVVTMTADRTVGAAFDLVPTGTAVSISAGGTASGSFLADTYYSGGTTYSTSAVIDTSLVPAPVPPQSVLQHERYGNFTYTVPGLVAGSPYAVTLYFAETFQTAAGQRLFSVAINGTTVLSAFDIFAAAGGANKAIARSFNATANAAGQVVIAFTNGAVDNAKVDGITVAPGTATTYYTLTVNRSGAGTVAGGAISCGSTCGAVLAAGTSVTLTATPTSPATFAGWSGACSGTTSTCVVSMSADRTVTAAFSGGSQGPCDIYQAANTPCVAAHSTVRALYAAYAGNLYQVRRADNSTRDIPVLTAGGFANTSIQDSFCANTTCTISIIYDQSPQHNDLKKAPPGATWLPNGGNESSATKGRTTVGGHTVYGIYVTAYSDNVAYRNINTTGVAKGNQAESMYMVVDGRRYSKDCCFDYGNAETNGKDNGNGTMAALYFGTDTAWGGKGDGNGPWIAADLENGMFKGNAGCYNCYPGPWPSAKSLAYNYVSAFLKDPAANWFALKGGNAQSGGLTTMWNDVRPTPNYYPKKLEGAIILGTGGDGSNGGTGTFFEGAMTIGNPPDSVDDAIQANIVAAGYGR